MSAHSIPDNVTRAMGQKVFMGADGACALFEQWIQKKSGQPSREDHEFAVKLYVDAYHALSGSNAQKSRWQSFREGQALRVFKDRALFSAEFLEDLQLHRHGALSDDTLVNVAWALELHGLKDRATRVRRLMTGSSELDD